MKFNISSKLTLIILNIIALVNITSICVSAEYYNPKVPLIRVIEGNPTRKIYVQTYIATDTKPLPEFQEYICIYGADGIPKSIAIIEPKTDITESLFKGNFNLSEDYIRIFLWSDMKPYSKGEQIYLNDINTKVIKSSRGGGGGDSSSNEMLNP